MPEEFVSPFGVFDPASHTNDVIAPLFRRELAADEAVPEEASGQPSGRAIHPDHFQPGDVVEINRNGVNCRAWMSTVAPSRCKLSRGERGVLLSAPVRFEQHSWVKMRLEQSNAVGYVATRYIDVIESRPISTAAASEPAEPVPAQHGQYRTGDLLITSVRLGLRTGPGIHHPARQDIERNRLGRAQDAPTLIDSVAWVPVRFLDTSGWIAAQHAQLFARQSRWIEVDLYAQELTAWDDELRVSSTLTSSGKPGYPTPAGAFTITRKIPVRRLRANLRGERWDIPGVPWLMAFHRGGFYLHAAYWHDAFGVPVSHGCVTLPIDYAEWLYDWTPPGTPIWIHY